MKKLLLLLFVFYQIPLFSQVGIETINPTATLDVNGNMRIRSLSATTNDSAAKDSILVSDNVGNIKRVSAKKVIESQIKTFIKGSFAGSGDISLTLASGTKKIPFNVEEFDTNDEFNLTTNTYTAAQSGIYQVTVHVKSASALSVATEFGVAILKNGVVINRDSFANIAVLTINVTPPVRSLQTLVSLNAEDTINFNMTSSLLSLSLDLSGNKEDSYFTIHQVK